MIVQLGALRGKPADQPDVQAPVAIDALVPTIIGVEVDERVLPAADLFGVEAGEIDQLDRIRAWLRASAKGEAWLCSRRTKGSGRGVCGRTPFVELLEPVQAHSRDVRGLGDPSYVAAVVANRAHHGTSVPDGRANV